jgi:hypothetical protein
MRALSVMGIFIIGMNQIEWSAKISCMSRVTAKNQSKVRAARARRRALEVEYLTAPASCAKRG